MKAGFSPKKYIEAIMRSLSVDIVLKYGKKLSENVLNMSNNN